MRTNTTLSTERMLAGIAAHSTGFAGVVQGHFDALVPNCPGWTVADLVKHVTEVHWFWTTIATERPEQPPSEDDPRRPSKLSDPRDAVNSFQLGAERLVQALRAADQEAQCWTWAPGQHTVGFITRHQVQEIAVHHWDAIAAAGGAAMAIEPDLADDAVTEFLEFSVSSEADAAPPERGSLPGSFRLRATDTGTVWQLTPGRLPATVDVEIVGAGTGASGVPQIAATAEDLLLWLYDRVALNTAAVAADVLTQFRTLSYTD